MQRSKQRKIRRARLFICGSAFGVLATLSVVFYFLRNVILFYGVHAGAAVFYPETSITFEGVEWKGRELVFSHVSVEGGGWAFDTDRFTVILDFDFNQRLFKPRIQLGTTHVEVQEGGEGLSLSPVFLEQTSYLRPELIVESGLLARKGRVALHFTLQQRGDKGGVLKLFKDLARKEALFSGSWTSSARGLDVSVSAEGLALDEFPTGFLNTIFPMQDELEVQGVVDLTLEATLTRAGKVDQMTGAVSVKNGSVTYHQERLDFFAKLAEIEFCQNGDVTTSLHLSFEGGQGRLGLLSEVTRLIGDLDWKEEKGLTGILEGVITRGQHFQPFHLEAKGAQEGAWLGKVAFEEKDSPEIDCIFERQSDGCKLATTFENIGPDVIDLIQEIIGLHVPKVMDWECSEGGFSGHMELQFLDSGELGIDVHELIGREVTVQNLTQRWLGGVQSCYVQGACMLEGSQVELSHLDLCFEKGAIDVIRDSGEVWNFSQLIGHLAHKDGMWAPSFVQGSFLGVEGEVKVEGPSLVDRGSFNLRCTADQLIALLSQELADTFHLEEDVPVQVAGHISRKGIHAKCHFDGSAQGALMCHIPPHFYDAWLGIKPQQEEGKITFQAVGLSPAIALPLMQRAGVSLQEGWTSVSLQGKSNGAQVQAEGHIALKDGKISPESVQVNWDWGASAK